MTIEIVPVSAYRWRCPACDAVGAALTRELAEWTGRFHVEQIHLEVTG